MHVFLSGVELPASPLTVVVSTALTLASNCIAEGDALSGASAGWLASFNIIAKDAFGNIKDDQNDVFNVSLHAVGTGEVVGVGDLLVANEPRNYYVASYKLATTGMYDIQVKLQNGDHINGSPFRIEIYSGEHSHIINGLMSCLHVCRCPQSCSIKRECFGCCYCW
jgi:hypothetical protein